MLSDSTRLLYREKNTNIKLDIKNLSSNEQNRYYFPENELNQSMINWIGTKNSFEEMVAFFGKHDLDIIGLDCKLYSVIF
jgi:hypothetical protein